MLDAIEKARKILSTNQEAIVDLDQICNVQGYQRQLIIDEFN